MLSDQELAELYYEMPLKPVQNPGHIRRLRAVAEAGAKQALEDAADSLDEYSSLTATELRARADAIPSNPEGG